MVYHSKEILWPGRVQFSSILIFFCGLTNFLTLLQGMRIVMDPSEFQAGLDSARNESMKAFGDQNMLVEKFVERPR